MQVLICGVQSQLHMVASVKGFMQHLAPKVLVLGALGRSGRGAVDVLESVGCQVIALCFLLVWVLFLGFGFGLKKKKPIIELIVK